MLRRSKFPLVAVLKGIFVFALYSVGVSLNEVALVKHQQGDN